MLDIKLIHENKDKVEQALKNRNMAADLKPLLGQDAERRKLTAETDALRAQKKTISEKFAREAKKDKDAAKKLSLESENLTVQIQNKEKTLSEIEQKIQDYILNLPNLPDESVPAGQSAKENKVIREDTKINMPRASSPVPHWDIGKKLDILDFDIASKISGTRFALLKGQGAALERALISFMLDLHIKEHGYTEILAPYLVNSKSMYGTGQLPKFEEELYKCGSDEDNVYLIPTAEVSVTNVHRDDLLNEDELPKKYVSYSACFRREAGSYGKDTKGLIRNHQFNKVELVKFTRPEDSMPELEKLTSDAEEVLKKLKLPYRVAELCTGDLGFSSSKTYDLEVWMPGEKLWREISSCSNFKDFQARRMNIKFKKKDGTKELVHTLNGSGVAIGRTFAAILENYQQDDGSVVVPEVLRRYIGIEKIK